MRAFGRWREWTIGQVSASILVGLLFVGCIATPLPTPPSADSGLMTLVESAQPQEVELSGAAGAIRDARRIRVTSSRGSAAADVDADGSFAVLRLPASLPPTLFIEAIADDEDVFLVAVTTGAGTGAAPIDPGADRDMDGSPDAIDCAADDPTLGGQRCPGLDVDGDGIVEPFDCDDTNPLVWPGAAELCNGLDEDCDGFVDEDCGLACAADSDCAGGQICVAGTCAAP